mgnify:CR=1 FL=1|tara:strand:- start:324 stop:1256 length:933 start_codon:yes stop_codon:yes gene_type:complete
MNLAHTEAVMTILNEHLGTSIKHKNSEKSFACPFCHHHKKKLQVNVENQKWHCWVCNAKGLTISSLLYKSKAPQHVFVKLKEIYGNSPSDRFNNEKQKQTICNLPEHYKPLRHSQNTPHYRNALHYAMKIRGLSALDIVKYEVGYCEDGPYSGMLVIPSYNDSGFLNYFVGRSFYENAIIKHKNPAVSKDVVGFDSHINWKEPVTIVEGAYDAITTKRNVIPLFGKKILPALRVKIINNKPPRLNLALDPDAYKDSLAEIEYFLNNGINVHYVDLKDKDPNETGYKNMIELVEGSQEITFFDLIKYKISI